MDDRIREHARTLVDWSAQVEAGDDVIVDVGPDAHELAVAVAAELGERRANLLTTFSSGEVSRAYLRTHGEDFAVDPAFELALYEHADVYLSLGGGRNTAEFSDVPGETLQARGRVRKGIREARMDTDWVRTAHPTRSLAQQAGMSYEAYREFVYDAILRDWESLADEMANMKALLDAGEAVHLETDRTDLTLDISGASAVNSAASVRYDSHNLPSGEVFTAPQGAEGTVMFDIPMTLRGRRVRDVRLDFEDGEVVDYAAAAGEDVITDIVETDDGARRLGELGIGMNRGIDRVTDNMLFDEKMGDTVHLALGRAYESTVPDGVEPNDSAVHVDMLVDMSEDATMTIDGEVVQRDGTFRWEDGFEG